jgi:hypothetical protein
MIYAVSQSRAKGSLHDAETTGVIATAADQRAMNWPLIRCGSLLCLV